MLSLRLNDLFMLLDESIQQVPDEHRGPILATFCSLIKREHKVAQGEIDEAVRMLIFKDDCKKGFVKPGGVVRRKQIVATRSVPVSKGEEMGDNGLMWRDARY
jgi:hypothetical protein